MSTPPPPKRRSFRNSGKKWRSSSSRKQRKTRQRRQSINPQRYPQSPAGRPMGYVDISCQPAPTDINIHIDENGDIFVRLTKEQITAILPAQLKELFSSKIPFPPYTKTFDTLTAANILKIADLYDFDETYPNYDDETKDTLTKDNKMYFRWISAAIRDKAWQWNKAIVFAVEKKNKKKKAKISVAYKALQSAELLVIDPNIKADLLAKANAYIIRLYKQNAAKSKVTTVTPPTFAEQQSQRETQLGYKSDFVVGRLFVSAHVEPDKNAEKCICAIDGEDNNYNIYQKAKEEERQTMYDQPEWHIMSISDANIDEIHFFRGGSSIIKGPNRWAAMGLNDEIMARNMPRWPPEPIDAKTIHDREIWRRFDNPVCSIPSTL